MPRFIRALGLLLVFSILGGCLRHVASSLAARPEPLPLASCVPTRREAPRLAEGTPGLRPNYFGSPREEWIQLARGIPGGFAGFRRDQSTGKLVMLMVDTTKAAAARAALLELMRTKPETVLTGATQNDLPNAGVREARWSVPELHEWMRYLSIYVSSSRATEAGVSVRGLGLAELDNVLLVSVPDESNRAKLEAFLAPLSLPCNLVVTEIIGPISQTEDYRRL